MSPLQKKALIETAKTVAMDVVLCTGIWAAIVSGVIISLWLIVKYTIMFSIGFVLACVGFLLHDQYNKVLRRLERESWTQ